MTSEVAQAFISQALKHLREDFVPKIRRCLELLSQDEIWWRPNQKSNSIGNLLLHLCGNVRQWIVAGVGGEVDVRKRDLEFAGCRRRSGPELLNELEATVEQAAAVICSLGEPDLLSEHHIQVYDVTSLQSIFHVVEHFSYHTGQIVFITKMLKDIDLGFYAQLEKS
ncbi:MAG: DinB family protein [Acidobacteriota bacterium]